MRRRNEVAVGVLVTIALIVLVVGAVWLARGGLSSGYPLHTRFAWGQALKKGQPVMLAGVSVGYVDDVKLRRDGFLDVKLNVADEYTIPRGSDATVIAVGIFGDVAVSLNPPLPVPEENYSPGDTVPAGAPSASVSTIMNRVDSIGGSLARLTEAIEADLVAAGGLKDLRRTMASTAAVSADLQGVLRAQNANLTVTMAEFRRTAQRAGSLIDSATVDSTMRNMRAASANLAVMTATMDSAANQLDLLMRRINAGEGSAGMLARDTTLYTSTRNLLARMDSLMLDFQRNPRKYINLRIF